MSGYAQPLGNEPRRSTSFAWPVIVLLLLIGILIWRISDLRGVTVHDAQAAPRPVTARGDLAADEKSTIELFREASPSIVHITTLTVRRDRYSTNLLAIPQGTGSGFIWSEAGYVVTNYHVVQNAQAAKVVLSDNSSWDGQLVGVSPDNELAVLKIAAPAAKMRPLLIGTSSDLQVGQKVFAIGNPFGLDQTLTTGVISGLGREIESVSKRPIQGVIQTDAAINPGNSGGPLLDSAGRLIGINTAIYSPSGAYAGIGFAVPVDSVNQAVPELIKKGRVERPGLGIQVAPDQIMTQLKLTGVLIMGFSEDSAAEAAGLQATTRNSSTGEIELGDRIVAIGKEEIKNGADLMRVLRQYKVGETVTVKTHRDDSEKLYTVTLQAVQE